MEAGQSDKEIVIKRDHDGESEEKPKCSLSESERVRKGE